MATKQINAYTAATTIDASADYLLIDPASSGTYNKINRNTLMGITGAPIGTTDTQSLSNKTIGNTNTLTIKDANFTLQDDIDTTKQMAFQLSGITTGTTRTITVPDASLTMVGTATTQTLTNKTLTSPTITGGTYDNGTITVDSISGHTVATTVTVGNVQMANGVINTSGAVTATSIAAGAVQPQALVSGTGSGWTWSSFTPTLTNFTVGNGSMTGYYSQTGKIVCGHVDIKFGTTSTWTGNLLINYPVAASSHYDTVSYLSLQFPIGNTIAYDSSAVTQYYGTTVVYNTTAMGILVWNATGTNLSTQNAFSASQPFTWATNDILSIEFCYEAA